jgi:prepilin-type N-terminal cleavage/methylation domain-containing protein
MPLITAYTEESREYKRARGFTLLELSIVLVVIGLITSGIMVGRTLIRQSQINSAMMDAQRYISAAGTFQQKYGSWPGDMANATDYWGSMTTAGLTCPPASGSVSPGGTLTCGGDGNGQVMVEGLGTAQNEAEGLFFWQHLVNAQLIQGSYTGISATGAGNPGWCAIGVNCPTGKLSGLEFEVVYEGIANGGGYFFNGTYNHAMLIGGDNGGGVASGPIITAAEAQSFDNKYDDGFPSTGSVTTWQNSAYNGNCVTSATPPAYNTSTPGPLCSLIITTGF